MSNTTSGNSGNDAVAAWRKNRRPVPKRGTKRYKILCAASEIVESIYRKDKDIEDIRKLMRRLTDVFPNSDETAYRRGVHQSFDKALQIVKQSSDLREATLRMIKAIEVAHDFRYDGKEHYLLLDCLIERVLESNKKKRGRDNG